MPEGPGYPLYLAQKAVLRCAPNPQVHVLSDFDTAERGKDAAPIPIAPPQRHGLFFHWSCTGSLSPKIDTHTKPTAHPETLSVHRHRQRSRWHHPFTPAQVQDPAHFQPFGLDLASVPVGPLGVARAFRQFYFIAYHYMPSALWQPSSGRSQGLRA